VNVSAYKQMKQPPLPNPLPRGGEGTEEALVHNSERGLLLNLSFH